MYRSITHCHAKAGISLLLSVRLANLGLAISPGNKFIWGPLILHRIRFWSLNPKTRYNRSLNYQNRCKRGPSAVLADVAPTWLVWLGIRPTWHWRGTYVAIIFQKNNKNHGPTCQLKKNCGTHMAPMSFSSPLSALPLLPRRPKHADRAEWKRHNCKTRLTISTAPSIHCPSASSCSATRRARQFLDELRCWNHGEVPQPSAPRAPGPLRFEQRGLRLIRCRAHTMPADHSTRWCWFLTKCGSVPTIR